MPDAFDLKKAAFEQACEQWAIENPDTGDGLHTTKLPPLPEGAQWFHITEARGRLAMKRRAFEAYYKAATNGVQSSAQKEPAGERAPVWPSRMQFRKPIAWNLVASFVLAVALAAAVIVLACTK